ncbi:MAG: threonine--tRNA ligase [Clostridia bacterium]|nr:threonine--tRNA ligase [Clostridia bacterium]
MFRINFGEKIFEADAPLSVYDAARGAELTMLVVLAASVGGKTVELTHVLDADADVKLLTFADAEGRHAFWHTTSHVLAQAVKRLFPEVKLAIGPAIEQGFYYDFDVKEPFRPEDLEKIEGEMKKIVKENIRLERFTLPRDEAIAFMEEREEPYKVELIRDLPEGEEISFYRQGDFTDLCAGPHLFSTGAIKAFKLTSATGAYWRGDANNKMLCRVYGVSFPTKDELKEHLDRIEEAKQRDHKKLGREMELFMFHETAPGMPYFLPRGWTLYNALLEYWRGEHRLHNYQEISGPVLSEKQLWVTSGHWDHYQDGMFVIPSDENTTYAMKPMNCPNAINVFRSRQRSYRELPIRYSQTDVIHRKEKSGELNGLFRVQQFHQDDAHIFVEESGIEAEISDIMDIAKTIYGTFGLTYTAELSTRPDDYMGDLELWNKAEESLKAILTHKFGADGFEINEGDGAFYGPKIDLGMRDCLGRQWQMGTIQLDFQLPLNFDLKYVAEDGSMKRPVMIHRAIFGSMERFIGIITEHFKGQFPFWLAPVEVGVVPIRTDHNAYARRVVAALEDAGIRTDADYTDQNMKNKIRHHKEQRAPYVLVIGDSEAQNGTVSVNVRGSQESVRGVPLESFVRRAAEMKKKHELELEVEFG